MPHYYSNYHYRIKPIFTSACGYTWIFLPGGPGLGSAYLEPFCAALKLPGSKLLADFPKDGTNSEGLLNLAYWKKGLIDVLEKNEKPILVTHSFSGMFALDTPELESCLTGLVLMNTTSKNSFFEQISTMQQLHHLPDLTFAAAKYHLHPSSESYKAFWDTYKHYCFTAEELPWGETMIPLLAFNHKSYHYAIEHFYSDYQCRWYPKVPTLTISSEHDFICPTNIFRADSCFQQEHILNKTIPKAGHWPWLLYSNEIQQCFNEFINTRLFYPNA